MSVTQADVENLKRSWLADPCWDIECTEGFEAYYEELKVFHEQTLIEWEKEARKEHEARIDKVMSNLGLSNDLCQNRVIVEYILSLQDRIDYLEDRLDRRISRLEN